MNVIDYAQLFLISDIFLSVIIVFSIYRYYEKFFIKMFIAALSVYFLHYIFSFSYYLFNKPSFILISRIFALLIAPFIVELSVYIDGSSPKKRWRKRYTGYVVLAFAVTAWIIFSYYINLSFFYQVLPAYVALGLAYIFAGWRFVSTWRKNLLYTTVGVTFILWGLLKFSYPAVLHTWFAPYGFALAAFFLIVTVLSIAIIVIDRFHQDSEEKMRAIEKNDSKLRELVKIITGIHTVLDETSIFHRLVDGALKLTDAKDGTFGIYRNGKISFYEYLTKNRWVEIDYSFPKGYGVPGHIIETKKPYISNDCSNDPIVIPEIREKLGFYNLIDVPVIYEDNLLGCFEIHNKISRTDFDQTDKIFLEIAANNAALSITNARLIKQIRRSKNDIIYLNKIIVLLRNINQMIAKRVLISDIYRATCSELVKSRLAKIACVAIYDANNIRLAAYEGEISRESAKDICRYSFYLDHDEPFVANNLYNTANLRALYKIADIHHFRRAAFFPLTIEGRIYGELFVSFNSDIDDSVINFLKELAGDIAVAIRLSETERLTITRNRLFSMMRIAYKMVMDNALPEEIFDYICKELKIIFNAKLVWVGKKEKRGVIKPVGYEGEIEMVEDKLRWETERGAIYPFAEALIKCELYVAKIPDDFQDNGYKTEVAIPICRKNDVYGVLDIYSRKNIDKTLVVMLEYIGNQLYIINSFLKYTKQPEKDG